MNLYNADCLEIMQEIPDKEIDCIITDPPYGININDGKSSGKIGGWGCVEPTDYPLFDDSKPPSFEYFNEIFRISKNQIIFGGNYFYLPPSRCWIVWDKDNTGNFADAELAWTSFNSSVRIFKYRWNGMLQEDMNHKEKRIHPTQKPIKLFEWIIKNFTSENDLIMDPFFGSGSCLVAAVRLGHSVIGIEKEKTYFNLGKKRIEYETHQEKLNPWVFEESSGGWI